MNVSCAVSSSDRKVSLLGRKYSKSIAKELFTTRGANSSEGVEHLNLDKFIKSISTLIKVTSVSTSFSIVNFSLNCFSDSIFTISEGNNQVISYSLQLREEGIDVLIRRKRFYTHVQEVLFGGFTK